MQIKEVPVTRIKKDNTAGRSGRNGGLSWGGRQPPGPPGPGSERGSGDPTAEEEPSRERRPERPLQPQKEGARAAPRPRPRDILELT